MTWPLWNTFGYVNLENEILELHKIWSWVHHDVSVAHLLGCSGWADFLCGIFTGWVARLTADSGDCSHSFKAYFVENHVSTWSYAVVFVFAAAGLYYLAEMVEEYSVLAKKILVYLLVVSSSLIPRLIPCSENETMQMDCWNKGRSLPQTLQSQRDCSRSIPMVKTA